MMDVIKLVYNTALYCILPKNYEYTAEIDTRVELIVISLIEINV